LALQTPQASTMIAPGASLGPVTLGARIDEVYRVLGLRGQRYRPDPPDSGDVVRFLQYGLFRAGLRDTYGAMGVATHTWYLTQGLSRIDPHWTVVESDRGKVAAIAITGEPSFRTGEGLGVGSGEVEIRLRFGAPDRVSEGLGARSLMYLQFGIHFDVVLDEGRYAGGVTFLRELVRGYQGKAYVAGVFCRWSRTPGGLATTSDC
jgi:hypothetical protein